MGVSIKFSNKKDKNKKGKGKILLTQRYLNQNTTEIVKELKLNFHIIS